MTLQQLRERRDLNQVQLAKLAGLDSTTVSQLELGKIRGPRYTTLMALAIALRTTPEAVMDAINESIVASVPSDEPQPQQQEAS